MPPPGGPNANDRFAKNIGALRARTNVPDAFLANSVRLRSVLENGLANSGSDLLLWSVLGMVEESLRVAGNEEVRLVRYDFDAAEIDELLGVVRATLAEVALPASMMRLLRVKNG